MAAPNLIIWGCGGHAKVVLDVVRAADRFREIVFIDDAADSASRQFQGYPVLGDRRQVPLIGSLGGHFLIAIGPNQTRAECFEECLNCGLHPAVAVHPSAVLSVSSSAGGGTVVMPLAVVNAGTVIGVNCIINTSAVVEHDCRIAGHVHISPGAVLGGGVRVGAYTHIGLGAVILPGVEIGERCVVGAGAVVLKPVAAGLTVAGVPARVIGRTTEAQLA